MRGLQHTGAFVIQFSGETNVISGPVGGRIEHVASSKATRFHSLDELIAFVAEMLAAVHSEEMQG